MKKTSDPPVKATTTSTRVLEALVELGESNLTAVEDEVGLSKSSIHNHLETLVYLGFVVKENQTYRLSLRFFEIGASVRRQIPFYRTGRTEVDRLADISGLAAGLTVLERGHGVCIYDAIGQKVETAPVEEGARIPLFTPAPGKAILATLPEEKLDVILDAQRSEAVTDQPVTDVPGLRSELETVRTRGLASDREEWRPNLRGLAAGFTDPDRNLFGAIYVLSPSESMSGKRFQQDIPGLVISGANQIRKSLRDTS